MPASSTMARVASRPNVAGRSRLMPASGPTPGSTPTSVPITHPAKAYRRIGGCSATPKPSARFWSVSSTPSEPERSHRQRDLEERVEEVERAPRHAHREGDGWDETAALDRAHQEEESDEHARPVAEPLEPEGEKRA